MRIEITGNHKTVRTQSGQKKRLSQIRALDYIVISTDDEATPDIEVPKGTLGGFIDPNSVTLGPSAWIDKDVNVFGDSIINGVISGKVEVEDSTIGEGTIINAKGFIRNATIGNGVSVCGHNRLDATNIGDDATICGAVIRGYKIGAGAKVNPGTVDRHIRDEETFNSPELERYGLV